MSYIRDLILAESGEVLPRGSRKLSPHLAPIPRKQKPVLAEPVAEATQARHRCGLLDAFEVHERELAPLCFAELALRRRLGDSGGVQLAQPAMAAARSDRNAQGLVEAMTESTLEKAALHAERRMQQEAGDQGGYQRALPIGIR